LAAIAIGHFIVFFSKEEKCGIKNKYIMNRKFPKEDLFLVFLSSLSAILSARLFIFFYFKEHFVSPEIIIGGNHFYHFLIIGIPLVLISRIINYFHNRENLISLFCLGAGAGLILDEFSIWFPFLPHDYWGIANLLIIFGLIVFSFSVLHFCGGAKKINPAAQNKIHKNPENPAISVVIPVFNEQDFIAKTLQSLTNQDYNNFELIVVDNNSFDKTAEIAEKFGAKIIAEKEQGVGFARQRGFLQARAEIIATTDGDTVVPRNWLSMIISEFNQDKELVAFGGLFLLNSGPLFARAAVKYLTSLAWGIDRFFGGGWSIPGVNLAVKKEAFLRVGGFNQKLAAGEDSDLSQRLKRMGKVKLDTKFLVETSGRRYTKGLLRAIFINPPHWIAKIIPERNRFVKLPYVREENQSLQFSSVLIFFVLALFIFSFFYLSNPLISSAKQIVAIKEELSDANGRMVAGGHYLSQSFRKTATYMKFYLKHLREKHHKQITLWMQKKMYF
jgi:glycosyltransferase involved in cell wall biosynthesis